MEYRASEEILDQLVQLDQLVIQVKMEILARQEHRDQQDRLDSQESRVSLDRLDSKDHKDQQVSQVLLGTKVLLEVLAHLVQPEMQGIPEVLVLLVPLVHLA